MKACFYGTQFDHNAEFKNATFLKEACFQSKVIFRGNNFFNKTYFLDNCTYQESNFDKIMGFNETVFCGKENIINVNNISNDIHKMERCIFIGNITMKDEKKKNIFFNYHCTDFLGKADFSTEVLKDFYFFNCYMAGCSFKRSDFTDTVFLNCNWNPKIALSKLNLLECKIQDRLEQIQEKYNCIVKKHRKIINSKLNDLKIKDDNSLKTIAELRQKYLRCKRRDVLLDEIMMDNTNPDDLEEIKSTYNQLKLYFDKTKDYDKANDFYYGEMKMKTILAKIGKGYNTEERKSKKGWKWFKIDWCWALFAIPFILVLMIVSNILRYNDLLVLSAIFSFLIISIVISNIKGFFKYSFYKIYEAISDYGNRPLKVFIWFLIIICFLSLPLLNNPCFNKNQIDQSNFMPYLSLSSVSNSSKIKPEKIESIRLDLIFLRILSMTITNAFTIQNPLITTDRKLIELRASYPIQYTYLQFVLYTIRPLLVAILLISIKRKVKRG